MSALAVFSILSIASGTAYADPGGCIIKSPDSHKVAAYCATREHRVVGICHGKGLGGPWVGPGQWSTVGCSYQGAITNPSVQTR
jgi:hypothetical protein